MPTLLSIDPEKVTEALNGIDVTTFFGHIKFMTDPGHHGLQAGPPGPRLTG